MMLPFLRDLEDHFSDLLGLSLGETDLLTKLVISLNDLFLLPLVPITLTGEFLGLCQFIRDFQTCCYGLDYLLMEMGKRRMVAVLYLKAAVTAIIWSRQVWARRHVLMRMAIRHS